MRKIKFRGLSKYSRVWVYGSSEFEHESGTVVSLETFWRGVRSGGINSETVGEYTGLPDKNGVEIYEGDILFLRWTVKFGDFEFLSGEDGCSRDIYSSGYGWYIEDFKDGTCRQLLLEVHPTDEVIGNIVSVLLFNG